MKLPWTAKIKQPDYDASTDDNSFKLQDQGINMLHGPQVPEVDTVKLSPQGAPLPANFDNDKVVDELDYRIEENLTKRVLISLLTFSEFGRCARLLLNICPMLVEKQISLNLAVTIVVRNNNPLLDSAEFDSIWVKLLKDYPQISFMFFNDGHNVGFGRGHNLNFGADACDFCLILNDDIGLLHMNWLDQMMVMFRHNPLLGAIGATENPTSITPFFGNGVHDRQGTRWPLQYAEASILTVRAKAFQEIGGFDEDFTWAMFEDADLSFRMKALGYELAWVDIPHQHWRSSSVNALPGQIKNSILEHNRSVMMAKWNVAIKDGYIGRFEVYDLWSDGVGDVFCGLLHLAVNLRKLTPQQRGSIVINTSVPEIARLLVGADVEITSVSSLHEVQARFGQSAIRSLRSLRTINYGLPFNIHALICATLAINIATHPEISALLYRIPQVRNIKREHLGMAEGYCVLHLESDRQDHDGRVPSPVTTRNIAMMAGENFPTIVLVGKHSRVPVNLFNDKQTTVVDLQGKLSVEELIQVIAGAQAFVGIDSFPAHVAQAAGIRSAVFFGSIHPSFRVLRESLTWPIVKDIECIGCYHISLEPSIPFCMRRDMSCTKDINGTEIHNAISGCAEGRSYDWSKLSNGALELQRKFFMKMLFHPAPEKRFFDFKRVSTHVASTLVYQIIDNVHEALMQEAEQPFFNASSRELRELRAAQFHKDVRIESMVSLISDLRAQLGGQATSP